MNNLQRIEEIDKLIRKELTPAEEAAFNERLLKDPELQKEVDLQMALIQNIRASGRDEMLQRMQALYKEMENDAASEPKRLQKEKIKVRPVFARWTWLVAASIAISAGVFVYFIFKSSQNPEVNAELAMIEYITDAGNFSQGFAGADDVDSTYPVLIYPPKKTAGYYYVFDDTLRLYGKLRPEQLRLTHEAKTERYQLRIDTTTFALERYGKLKQLKK
ncbi:MAG TPA: hypothetical protein VGN64_04300 [Dyadobacter sp.]|jgi:hypothetical protein|nr:hypothetical protein [Dyadobacter sp.]